MTILLILLGTIALVALLWQRVRRSARHAQNRCPRCGEKMEGAFVFDGDGWAPSSLCPALCYGFLYSYEYSLTGAKLRWREIDGGGQPMALPEAHLIWKEDWPSDAWA